MKKLLQVFTLLVGILTALYVGGYVMCVGGIIDFVTALRADPVNAIMMAGGITKFFLASVVGWFIFYMFVALVYWLDE